VLEQISIAFFFEGALRNAVHHLKYKRVRRIAKPLADLLAQHWQQHAYPVDALQPVPLHPQRLAERGFNQSELLAAHLASLSGVPLLRTGLVRSRDTAHQVGLDARQRSVNVQDAFFWQAASAAPMRVLLIDDVVTTGATLEACAQALRNAGSREVRALVLARSRLEP
jgi:ComF family protein